MTVVSAAFIGMGLVLLFGLGALALAYWSRSSDHRHGHHPSS